MPSIPLVMCTYNHSFVKIKRKIQVRKCENLRLLKSRIFRNNIRVRIEEMRRFKLHIPTDKYPIRHRNEILRLSDGSL